MGAGEGTPPTLSPTLSSPHPPSSGVVSSDFERLVDLRKHAGCLIHGLIHVKNAGLRPHLPQALTQAVTCFFEVQALHPLLIGGGGSEGGQSVAGRPRARREVGQLPGGLALHEVGPREGVSCFLGAIILSLLLCSLF